MAWKGEDAVAQTEASGQGWGEAQPSITHGTVCRLHTALGSSVPAAQCMAALVDLCTGPLAVPIAVGSVLLWTHVAGDLRRDFSRFHSWHWCAEVTVCLHMGTEGRACSQLHVGPRAGSQEERCSCAAGVRRSLMLPPHARSVRGMDHICPAILWCRPEQLAALPGRSPCRMQGWGIDGGSVLAFPT
ncbi:neuralized-like protein 2 [Platysternon megacephalum]|uniref:Neuralized-like protein 2 n=1 Tax=Platysternon megacephalum TaxID=55544 RepID=A0A4D9E4P8_9SAUR|nr:neuralized-like protein 2 [Platysternon megacephalum]